MAEEKPSPISAEELVELVERLRGRDFSVGTQECIAAQKLLVHLAARGDLPADAGELRSRLAPIFCSTPEEQETFHRQFDAWLGLRHEPREPRPEEGSEAGGEAVAGFTGGVSSFLGGLRRKPLLLAVAALAAAVALTSLVVLSADLLLGRESLPPPRVAVGKVVSDADEPLGGATVSTGFEHVTSDGRGNFAIRLKPEPATGDIHFSREGYRPLGGTTAQAGEFIYARLQPLPKPTPITQGAASEIDKAGVGRAASLPKPTPTPSALYTLVPLPSSDPPWYVVYFALIVAAATLLPLLVFGAWWLLRLYVHRSQLEKWQAAERPEMDRLTVRGIAEYLFRGSPFRRTVQELRRHRPVDFGDLNIPRTVDETIRTGGWFKPAYSPRKLAPEYLALVDRASFGDQQARFVDELLARLRRDGVYISRYYFNGDPRVCRAEDAAAPHLTLGKLAGLHPEHHLLIFSDGAGLINPLTGRLQRWVERLAPWRQRALLTPASMDDWGSRESALASADFAIIPAGKDGLAALAEGISTGATPQVAGNDWRQPYPALLKERPQRWLEGTEPEAMDLNKLCFQLRLFLGADGYQWLCACAIYPALLWELTFYMGYRLLEPGRMEGRLLALVRLPWFRHEEMPDWLRARLISDLSSGQERAAREALADLLISALDVPSDGFQLEIAPRQPEATSPFWAVPLQYLSRKYRHLKSRMLLREYLAGQPDSPLHDFVFLNFLSGLRPRKLSVGVPGRLRERFRRLLYPKGMSVFGLRPRAAFAAALLASSCALAGVAYGVPADDRTGGFRFDIRMTDKTERPAYVLDPNVGLPGGVYTVNVRPDDCARADLFGAQLVSTRETVAVNVQGTGRCQLTATLSVAPRAAPSVVPLEIAKDGGRLGAVDFNILAAADTPADDSGVTITDVGPVVLPSCGDLVINRNVLPLVPLLGPDVPTDSRVIGYALAENMLLPADAYSYKWTTSAGRALDAGTGRTFGVRVAANIGGPTQPLTVTLDVRSLDGRCASRATDTFYPPDTFRIVPNKQEVIICPENPDSVDPVEGGLVTLQITPSNTNTIRAVRWRATAGGLSPLTMGPAPHDWALSREPPGTYTASAEVVLIDGRTVNAEPATVTVRRRCPTTCSLRLACPAQAETGTIINIRVARTGVDFPAIKWSFPADSAFSVNSSEADVFSLHTISGPRESFVVSATATAPQGTCEDSCTIRLTKPGGSAGSKMGRLELTVRARERLRNLAIRITQESTGSVQRLPTTISLSASAESSWFVERLDRFMIEGNYTFSVLDESGRLLASGVKVTVRADQLSRATITIP